MSIMHDDDTCLFTSKRVRYWNFFFSALVVPPTRFPSWFSNNVDELRMNYIKIHSSLFLLIPSFHPTKCTYTTNFILCEGWSSSSGFGRLSIYFLMVDFLKGAPILPSCVLNIIIISPPRPPLPHEKGSKFFSWNRRGTISLVAFLLCCSKSYDATLSCVLSSSID